MNSQSTLKMKSFRDMLESGNTHQQGRWVGGFFWQEKVNTGGVTLHLDTLIFSEQ